MRDQELEKELTHWRRTGNLEAGIAYLTDNLMNKILYQPTVKLRQAAYEEHTQLLLSVKELFDI